jgi:GT2 family glycosyltransferase
MSIRKQLIKLNNKLESSWGLVDFTQGEASVRSGWYVAEFLVHGNLDHTPRIVVIDDEGLQHERELIGFHAGRNRMLIYLPAGTLIAYSESLEFERLGRVSGFEGRARIILICGRYLRDFFSLSVLFKMLVMQFQDNFELSSNLLQFYAPSKGGDAYLENVRQWQKFKGFGKQISWFCGSTKIAVIIEDEAQRVDLMSMLLVPDAIVLAGSPLPEGIDFFIALNASERLRFPAMVMLKRAIRSFRKVNRDNPEFIYTDHDYERVNGETPDGLEPVFKPNPSRAYLHCFNYVGFACVFSAELANKVGSQAILNDDTKYRLALDAFSDTTKVLNISEALFSSSRCQGLQTPEPTSAESPWSNIEWSRNSDFNTLRAKNEWSQQPSVDLIIPTRDGLAVLKPCIDSILAKTIYQNFNVIVVDNGSEQAETFEYFAKITQDSRVSVVSYPGEFNYSAINNFAASKGDSDYVALVNNDIEIIDGDWLTQMMVWVIQPNVGIVGAKLLFENGLVQHAGVTIGMGNAAGHIHRLEERDAPGYQLRCLATQNMMAVTAACLITPRSLFEEIGGLDELNFKVAYNDVDYCLKVESRGYEIIWTPEAILYHHESVSRGDDMSEEHIERYFGELEVFQSRWKSKGFVDKYYSKHLRISDEGVFPQMERHADGKLVYLGENV